MVYSKVKKILFILLCLFVVLFPFWCVRGLCADGVISPIDSIEGKFISSNGTINTSDQGGGILIYHFYPNCAYTLENTSDTYNLYYSTSANLVTSGNIGNRYSLPKGTTINIDMSSEDTYLYIYITSLSDYENMQDYIIVTNTSSNMEAAVGGLVSDVGVKSIWNIFDISINYIVIVVLVALGLFIIFKIIRKVSKGKEGF